MLTRSKNLNIAATSPARRFFRLLGFAKQDDILDFGLKETPLVEATNLSRWLGIRQCFLKLEISHPTGTMKDRVIELTYSAFKLLGIRHYSHASTGNTGTSLAWGGKQFPGDFQLDLIVPEKQFSHYNFSRTPGVLVTLLEDATYDQARIFNEYYAKHFLKQPNLPVYSGEFRKLANKIMYLEAYMQMHKLGFSPDYVCQAISRGAGLLGAWRAAQDALAQGWFTKLPGIAAVQPEAADPIIRCYKAGLTEYDDRFTIPSPSPSKAFAIRRGDANSCYSSIREILDESRGFGESVSEKETDEAHEALQKQEGISAGFTACVGLAGIKKRAEKDSLLRNSSVLVMITGGDRPTDVTPPVDRLISRNEWLPIVEMARSRT